MSKQAEEIAAAYGLIGHSVQAALGELNSRMVDAMSRVSQSESDTDTH